MAKKDNRFGEGNLGSLGRFGGHRVVEEVDTILPVKFGLKRRSVDRDRSWSNLENVFRRQLTADGLGSLLQNMPFTPSFYT